MYSSYFVITLPLPFLSLSSGDKIWEKDFGSPVVGIYSLEKSQVLRSIPFTSLNDDTLQGMTASRALAIKNGLYSLTPTDTILQLVGEGGKEVEVTVASLL